MLNIHKQIQKTVLFILCIGEINLNLRQVPLEQVHLTIVLTPIRTKVVLLVFFFS